MAVCGSLLYHGRAAPSSRPVRSGAFMHLATYNIRGRSSFGVVSGDGVVDLRPRLAPRLTSVLDVLRAGALDEVKKVAAGVRADFPLTEVELLPPVRGRRENPLHRRELRQPRRRTDRGRRQHRGQISQHVLQAAEHHGRRTTSRSCGRRNPSSSNTRARSRLVIGKTGRRIPKDRALDHVAGITMCNEGTIRDWIGTAGSTSPRARPGTRPAASGRG